MKKTAELIERQAPIDAWYRYPIHVVDDTGELRGKKLVGASQKKSHEETLNDFVTALHVAYENLSYDTEGNKKEVTQPDLIKWMKMNRVQFVRLFKSRTSAAWEEYWN